MACLLFEVVNVKAKIGVLERLKHLSALVIIIAYGIGEGGGRLTVHWGITSRVNRSDSDEIWVGEYQRNIHDTFSQIVHTTSVPSGI